MSIPESEMWVKSHFRKMACNSNKVFDATPPFKCPDLFTVDISDLSDGGRSVCEYESLVKGNRTIFIHVATLGA
jgi:hypothetical protein